MQGQASYTQECKKKQCKLFSTDCILYTQNQGCIQGICLAVMTDPFVPQVGYSALKPMTKYQTMSLQVSDAGGFKQATCR